MNQLGEHHRKAHDLTNTQYAKRLRKSWMRTAQRLTWMTFACWGISNTAVNAAQRVTLRLGPFEQAIEVADLELFAKTGEVPSSLRFYAPVLATPQVREILNRRLQIDPNFADKVIEQVVGTPTGKQLINSLGLALPNTTVDELQATVSLAARQFNGLSIVGLLRAYPGENITIDASKAIALALEFNPSYIQTQALGPLLAQELRVPSNTRLPKFNPALPGREIVQQQTLFLQDRQRYRSIPVDLYWSTRQARLIVISHGYGSDRKVFASLARFLASRGFTVAAIEHPASNIKQRVTVSAANNPTQLLSAREFVARPQDVSFVLNELTKRNSQPGELQGKLNTRQVTVIGHSLGGYTALALAGAQVDIPQLRQYCQGVNVIAQAPGDWLQCAAASLPQQKLQLRDRRVVQVVALNPLVGQLFGSTGLRQVKIPVLMLAGTDDAITPAVNHQLRPFNQLQSKKYLITAIGATHLSIIEPTSLSSTTSNTLVKERLGADVKPLRQLTYGATVAFIEQLSPQAPAYAPFLTPAYAQSLSTARLPLRLNPNLPTTVTSWIDTGLRSLVPFLTPVYAQSLSTARSTLRLNLNLSATITSWIDNGLRTLKNYG